MTSRIWVLGLLAACDAPAWVEGCECASGQVCRASYYDYDPEGPGCVDRPDACAAVWTSGCDGDLGAIDDACLQAVCGAAVPTWDAQCWADGDGDWYWLACESSP